MKTSTNTWNRPEAPTACASSQLGANQLLAALPAADAARWATQMEVVKLARGQVLSEPGTPPSYVYFPITAIVSLMYTTEEGNCSEIAVVGHDGVVGISVFMGGVTMCNQALVQSAGQALRMPARLLRQELDNQPAVLRMLLSYTQALLGQVAQTAACNRYLSIDQLLCRRLLQGLDRSSDNTLAMTQEWAAMLLGVRREGVTGAALKLQQAGVIAYRRGRISVLDRAQLEARSFSSFTSTAQPSMA